MSLTTEMQKSDGVEIQVRVRKSKRLLNSQVSLDRPDQASSTSIHQLLQVQFEVLGM